MGRRDVGSFVVIVLFGASLAATSKPKPDRDEAEDGGRGRVEVAEADAGAAADSGKTAGLAVDAGAVVSPVKNAELPDTTAWKPFAYPAGKLSAKTPPNAEVTCTKAGDFTACVVTRHAKTIAAFSSNSHTPESSIAVLKHDTSVPSIEVFEDEKNLAVMRNDPKQGSWCELVASSPAGLTAVVDAAVADGGLHAVTLNRTECLEVIAFGRTLVRTP